jgi:hypothetical protein
MTKANKTLGGNDEATAGAKPKVKRPRAGIWTKTSKQIPVPGTETDIAVLDMYRVEYAGETLEVQRNRAGVNKANAWIRGIRDGRSELARVDKIRKQLEKMITRGGHENSTSDLAKRLKTAVEALTWNEPKEENR